MDDRKTRIARLETRVADLQGRLDKTAAAPAGASTAQIVPVNETALTIFCRTFYASLAPGDVAREAADLVRDVNKILDAIKAKYPGILGTVAEPRVRPVGVTVLALQCTISLTGAVATIDTKYDLPVLLRQQGFRTR